MNMYCFVGVSHVPAARRFNYTSSHGCVHIPLSRISRIEKRLGRIDWSPEKDFVVLYNVTKEGRRDEKSDEWTIGTDLKDYCKFLMQV